MIEDMIRLEVTKRGGKTARPGAIALAIAVIRGDEHVRRLTYPSQRQLYGLDPHDYSFKRDWIDDKECGRIRWMINVYYAADAASRATLRFPNPSAARQRAEKKKRGPPIPNCCCLASCLLLPPSPPRIVALSPTTPVRPILKGSIPRPSRPVRATGPTPRPTQPIQTSGVLESLVTPDYAVRSFVCPLSSTETCVVSLCVSTVCMSAWSSTLQHNLLSVPSTQNRMHLFLFGRTTTFNRVYTTVRSHMRTIRDIPIPAQCSFHALKSRTFPRSRVWSQPNNMHTKLVVSPPSRH